MKRLVVAGVQSGTGKTTIALAIMACFAASRRVQPFKVGPDYIDPSYHTRVCGRASRNLDTWMVDAPVVLELFRRACRDADVAVVEGVMGLFDGRTGEGQEGSTAQVARLLNAPVVLVVDAAKVARSAAAIVLGFRMFDPEVQIAGVILNRIGSRRHYDAVAGPIEREAGVPVLGYLPRDERLALPERYLGLIPVADRPVAGAYVDRLRAAVEQTIDLQRIERIAAAAGPLPEPPPRGDGAEIDGGRLTDALPLFPSTVVPPAVRIAVARDAAFSFYYEDNLDLLRAWGAEIAAFSPIADAARPSGVSGVYLGGGFPELHADELSSNAPMLRSLRAAAEAGMPVYGECGGLMYLGDRLAGADGRDRPMSGLLPLRSSMNAPRLTLGYRTLTSLRAGPLLSAGTSVRAHEFHWSAVDTQPDAGEAVYAVDGEARLEGFRRGSVLASYMHLHFAACPAIAPRFVDACRRWRADIGDAR